MPSSSSLPKLADLPAPPRNRNGWPWTQDVSLLPPCRPDGTEWPRITIVTPTYNRADFLETTIRSVLLQGYPNLEYIIIDGGSTDNSIELIKKYNKWISYWVSEKDRGQSDAINKGFAKAKGEIINWLNSDDTLMPGALKAVAEGFMGTDSNTGGVVGLGYYTDVKGNLYPIVPRPSSLDYETLLKEWGPKIIWQPACFYTKEAWEKSGPLDEELYFCMDMDLWLKIAKKFKFKKIDSYLACALKHESAKTTAMREYMAVEHALILLKRYGAEESALFYMKVHLADPLIAVKKMLHRITEHPIYKIARPVYRQMQRFRRVADRTSTTTGNQHPFLMNE